MFIVARNDVELVVINSEKAVKLENQVLMIRSLNNHLDLLIKRMSNSVISK